jgi:hypothetical protein
MQTVCVSKWLECPPKSTGMAFELVLSCVGLAGMISCGSEAATSFSRWFSLREHLLDSRFFSILVL